jgi:hypothetical protein
MVYIAVTMHALVDHLTTDAPPADEVWLCLDSTVMR